MIEEQNTIAGEARFDGIGLHTGERARVKLSPAPPGSGVTFIRTDLSPAVRIPATLESRRDNPRRSSLAVGSAEVHTVEHLLAVLNVLRVHNLEVEIDGSEMPGLDGSAREYLEGVVDAGLRGQGARARHLEIRDPVAVQSDNASLVALPSTGDLRVSYTLHYEGPPRVTQHLSLAVTAESFAKEIAPARTFVLESEVKDLQVRGLGRGANAQNTLVIGQHGALDNQLRFPDEMVRHKILDLLGDMYLLGSRVTGHFVAHRSGHFLNVELVQKLSTHYAREREIEGILANAQRGLDIRQLQRLLPHRYPFLLIDRILEIDGDSRAVGLKNVTFNEEFFQGHFPGQPVMPGVLQIEAMAQLAGVLLLRKSDNVNKLAYILSIDNVKFRRTVVPGDQLILEAEVKKVKSRTGQVQTRASVDGSVVAEAMIRFMIVDAY
ncbi:MAG: UDP-3-O-acyl-N-acetylglucosamine deacetylase [Planctomycetes bacterium]|nr:UDP-3-O-acyl-N-acetylglucosamine deacetylase [Planctomycetota bacterium]